MISAGVILAIIISPIYVGVSVLCFIQSQIHRTPLLTPYQWNWAFFWWMAGLATSCALQSWAFLLDSNYAYCVGLAIATSIFAGCAYAQRVAITATKYDVTWQSRSEALRTSQADDDDSWVPLQNE
jgi:hypothetical protein